MVVAWMLLCPPALATLPWLLADEQAETLLMRLDPVSRARVLMALLALILIGAGLIAMVWLLGRYMRRLARKPYRSIELDEDAWYRKSRSATDHESNEAGDA